MRFRNRDNSDENIENKLIRAMFTNVIGAVYLHR